jgi:hypothetical protein
MVLAGARKAVGKGRLACQPALVQAAQPTASQASIASVIAASSCSSSALLRSSAALHQQSVQRICDLIAGSGVPIVGRMHLVTGGESRVLPAS